MIERPLDPAPRPRYSRPCPTNPTCESSTRILSKAEAADQALERRQEAERQAYQLLRELLPHSNDDESNPGLTALAAEISGVVYEREKANREFTYAVLGLRDGLGRQGR